MKPFENKGTIYRKTIRTMNNNNLILNNDQNNNNLILSLVLLTVVLRLGSKIRSLERRHSENLNL